MASLPLCGGFCVAVQCRRHKSCFTCWFDAGERVVGRWCGAGTSGHGSCEEATSDVLWLFMGGGFALLLPSPGDVLAALLPGRGKESA